MISEKNATFLPELYLDTFFDYKKFIENPIGKITKDKLGTKIAIVGAGASGLMAARLLLEVGLEPVIFEASDRIGGRLYSKHFSDKNGLVEAFAELGAMRIPLSSQVFFSLTNQFGMDTSIGFPDPGLVDTLLSYQNQKFYWKAKTPVPKEFSVVKKNWEMLISPLIEKLITPWRKGDLRATQEIWQNYIDHYKGISFYEAIRQGSPVWADDELNRFGTLGIETGGFGPLYHIGFLEILRIVMHKWEYNQKLITEGVEKFAHNLLEREINTPYGTQSVGKERVMLNHQIYDIKLTENNRPELYIRANGKKTKEIFPAVIVTTSTRAMQFFGLSSNENKGRSILENGVQAALRKMHINNSSKLFIRTEDKFWKKTSKKMPLTVISDELASATYLLDYPQTKNGIVCVSYTWGDDSTKISGIEPMERFLLYKDSLAKIVPEIAENLVPVENEILHIDWQTEKFYYGAFKLNLPGQEDDSAELYFQYQSVNNPKKNTGIYLAGDGVSWAGGWIEGALHTAINAACATLKQCGGEVLKNSPLDIDKHKYKYH